MLNAGTLTFQEFMVREPLPLATIQNAVLEFLQGRDDAVVFGAQAVNAYVSVPRMTQDIDLLSPRAETLASELQTFLRNQFHIAVRIRRVARGKGCVPVENDRLFLIQKSGNRHLVDIRLVDQLPATRRIAQVLVMAPEDLIASKVISYHQRRGKPKAGTDWRDLTMLLLAFPDLKQAVGPVAEQLKIAGADANAFTVWQELVKLDIEIDDEDEGY